MLDKITDLFNYKKQIDQMHKHVAQMQRYFETESFDMGNLPKLLEIETKEIIAINKYLKNNIKLDLSVIGNKIDERFLYESIKTLQETVEKMEKFEYKNWGDNLRWNATRCVAELDETCKNISQTIDKYQAREVKISTPYKPKKKWWQVAFGN